MDLAVNGVRREIHGDPDRLLLFVLRHELDLMGTKYGCGAGECGACTVLLDGIAVRSCQAPVKAAAGKQVTTVESPHLRSLRDEFTRQDAIQCGYCFSGMIMTAAALLAANPEPSDAEIRSAVYSNLCRCGMQVRIMAAVRAAAADTSKS
jgi:aerobic-type carbon monoxide dehydrogenase small subunit (CoxS/CutS family)